MASEILVNSDLDNGFVPNGTKPIAEAMLTYHQLDPCEQISMNSELK